MVNYDSDAASDLLTVTAKPKPKDKAQHGMTNMKAAEKYEKMMKERQRREKELRNKQQLFNMFNGSKLYKSTLRGDSLSNSQLSLRRSNMQTRKNIEDINPDQQSQSNVTRADRQPITEKHQSQIENLLEECNEAMLKPTHVDQEAIQTQEKAGKGKIEAIERLMDEISIQYDPTDIIYLKDIERI